MSRSQFPSGTGRFLAFDDVDGFRLQELRFGVNHVGSGFDASIRIERAAGVSARHAIFVVDVDGAVEVADDRSREGTWVNGVRVERRRLAPGDTLRLGASVLSLVVTAPREQRRKRRPHRRYRRLIPTAAAAAALIGAGTAAGAAAAGTPEPERGPQVTVAEPAQPTTPSSASARIPAP